MLRFKTNLWVLLAAAALMAGTAMANNNLDKQPDAAGMAQIGQQATVITVDVANNTGQAVKANFQVMTIGTAARQVTDQTTVDQKLTAPNNVNTGIDQKLQAIAPNIRKTGATVVQQMAFNSGQVAFHNTGQTTAATLNSKVKMAAPNHLNNNGAAKWKNAA